MKYFKCSKPKCGNIYIFPSQPPVQLMQCGAFIGYKKTSVEWSNYSQEVPVGCGGQMLEITEQDADGIVETMRTQ